MKKISCLLCCFLFCFLFLTESKSYAKGYDKAMEKEMRGVWVATVNHIDFPQTPTVSADVLQKEIDTTIANCKELGFNAVFLQVRPNCDAIYPSRLFPWSVYLTGTQGKAPEKGFDPLAYWIQAAHKNGMELHAWLNPYRITSNGVEEWNRLSSRSPARQHPDWVIQYTNGNFYFNPAIPEVRQLIEDGVMEILNHYEVDGIHMDDYFYPGKNFPDTAYYQSHNNGEFSNIEDYRRNQVNLLIQELDKKIHGFNPELQWGISPSGVWENASASPLGSNTNGGNPSYSNLYADTRLWALQGWVDYIAPQIYWQIGHPKADYETLVNWWAKTLENAPTKLYIGLADYKGYQAKPDSIWFGGTQIQKQMELNERTPKVLGEIHFRYGLIVQDSALSAVIKAKYHG